MLSAKIHKIIDITEYTIEKNECISNYTTFAIGFSHQKWWKMSPFLRLLITNTRLIEY